MAWMTIAPRIDPKARINRSPARNSAAVTAQDEQGQDDAADEARIAVVGTQPVHRTVSMPCAAMHGSRTPVGQPGDQRLDPRGAQGAGRGEQVQPDRWRVQSSRMATARPEARCGPMMKPGSRAMPSPARTAGTSASPLLAVSGPCGRTDTSAPPGWRKRQGRDVGIAQQPMLAQFVGMTGRAMLGQIGG